MLWSLKSEVHSMSEYDYEVYPRDDIPPDPPNPIGPEEWEDEDLPSSLDFEEELLKQFGYE